MAQEQAKIEAEPPLQRMKKFHIYLHKDFLLYLEIFGHLFYPYKCKIVPY